MKGRKRCRLHGGKSPRGPDSPHFKHGRHSLYVPDSLRPYYEFFAENPEAAGLKRQQFLLLTRQAQLLGELDSAPPYKGLAEAWARVAKALEDRDPEALATAVPAMAELVESGEAAFRAWDEIRGIAGDLAKLTETERKAAVTAAGYISPEQMLALARVIVEVARVHVPPKAFAPFAKEVRLRLLPGGQA